MALKTERLKFVDSQTNLLVTGYTKSFNDLKNEHIFPTDIINMIILFLFEIEKFIKSGKEIEIIDGGTKATIVDDNPGYTTVHGKLDIDCGKYTNAIYKWKFNVQADGTSIGIDSDTQRQYVDKYCFPAYASDKARYFYAMGDTGDLEYNCSDGPWTVNKPKEYSDYIKKGDEIDMILDVSTKTMIFYKNGKNLGVAYDDIDADKIYHMAICLGSNEPDEFIEIVDFDVVFC